ncbi:unnamed protein product [Caenorhabditis angaria]|uniref:Uncharacterized protein n=1 Tax=Caenorhabditis angaria TaxID=860376 RepID=A0A9P1N3D1_9PELO|nr:unnamed protein product [Caenorhabditis angaria]
MSWEKGVIVGISCEFYFIASSYDEVLLGRNFSREIFQIGDCIRFTASKSSWKESGFKIRREVLEYERCEKFIEWEMQNKKNAALLISEIVDVAVEYHEDSKKDVRCLRTRFLEKVYDSGRTLRTSNFSERELLGKKVVAVRITNDWNDSYWAALNVISDRNPNGRVEMKGIVMMIPSKDTTDNLYVRVPFRDRDVIFPLSARGNHPDSHFFGNWISFTLPPSSYVIDNGSNVRLIEDVYPTQRIGMVDQQILCWKVRDLEEIVDKEYVLEKYQRFSTFTSQAWIYHFHYDIRNNIRFVLSDKQEEWDYKSPERYRKEQNFRRERSASERSSVDSWDQVRNENSYRKDKENSRYDNSDLRKRDDTNSIPSTSKSFEESQSIRNNLMKLKKKYDYLTENDMEIPEKLIEELKKARIEEQNSAKIKNFNYDDFDENHSRISEIRKKRELAKIEIDGEELRKYKKLVTLFRDMMSCEKVCDEMRKFDERSMKNINRLILEL